MARWRDRVPDIPVDERPALLPGDETRCKRCGRWHVVEKGDLESPLPDVRSMLWFRCPRAGGLFYAGRLGMMILPDELADWRPGNRLVALPPA